MRWRIWRSLDGRLAASSVTQIRKRLRSNSQSRATGRYSKRYPGLANLSPPTPKHKNNEDKLKHDS